jgi:molybdopterin molybdotransferase
VDGDGRAPGGAPPRVAVVGGPGSHLVASMAAADVLIDVPASATTLGPGADVTVWPL